MNGHLPPPNTIKIEGNDNDVTWSDSEPDATGDRDNDIGVVPSDMLPKHDSQDVPAEAISAGFEEEDPTTQVMLKSIQDPALAPIYDGLPDLGVYRSVRQYAYVNTVGMGVVTLQNIQSQMGAEDISRLVRALLFTKSGFFVNPARASPNVFVADAGRLKLKEPSSVAVCIMTGIVTECAVISDGYTGGPDNEKTVHKVSLAPFRQDFRRDTTMWGKILSFDNLSCAISTEGLSFTTRPRTLSAPMFTSSSAGSVLLSPRTPRKGGSRAMTVMHSPAPARRSDNYITARTFEQRVPIYDGRSVEGAREFTFSDTDFAKLSSWPLYERGLQDVPYDAVVSVGYTLNTFGEGPRGPNGLSTNLHFVILLALPNDLEA
ncbi:hypothetical protein BYT27DRAFT_7245428 [Phlegmacium glaucopus]|nr:hypothetical protein BYT27DRAFT_7245428 [Phlegmacium glaucopus]